MSKFWGGSSDSEEEEFSEEERSEELSEKSEEEDEAPVLDLSDTDTDEEEKRVVRSAKAKRTEEMMKIIGVLNGHIKENDWNAIYNGTLLTCLLTFVFVATKSLRLLITIATLSSRHLPLTLPS